MAELRLELCASTSTLTCASTTSRCNHNRYSSNRYSCNRCNYSRCNYSRHNYSRYSYRRHGYRPPQLPPPRRGRCGSGAWKRRGVVTSLAASASGRGVEAGEKMGIGRATKEENCRTRGKRR